MCVAKPQESNTYTHKRRLYSLFRVTFGIALDESQPICVEALLVGCNLETGCSQFCVVSYKRHSSKDNAPTKFDIHWSTETEQRSWLSILCLQYPAIQDHEGG